MILAFIGDNSHMRSQAATEFIDGFIGSHGSVAVDKFDAENTDFSQLNDAVSSVPFLSERRLVVVRDLSANKLLAEKLTSLADNVIDNVDFVIIESHIDNRSKYLTTLRAAAEVREFNNLDDNSLLNWLVSEAEHLGGHITRASANELVNRVGTNQQLLSSELKKLLLFDPQITTQTINSLTTYTPQSSIFNMLDAAIAGDQTKALNLYQEQRTQGMEPQAILAMLTWQLHTLALVKSAGNMPAGDIAKQSKLSPFVIRKNQTHARNITSAKLVNLYDQAIKTDTLLKTSRVNSDDAVQALIVSFA